MNEQKLRDKRILSNLKLDKLPFKIQDQYFKKIGSDVSNVIHYAFTERRKTESLNWCFANIKRVKIFLEVFHANEAGREIYKEEIAKKIPEYSYKTIAKIIDDGILQGHYVLLAPDGEGGKDGKVKNIRPSEELAVDFLNLSIEIIAYINTKNKL